MAGEAVEVRQETLLGTDELKEEVATHAGEYSLAGVNTDAWFPHVYTNTRGSMDTIGGVLPYDERFIAMSAMIASACEKDARNISIEKKAVANISAVINRAAGGTPQAEIDRRRDLDAAFRIITRQAREFDIAWRDSNAIFSAYENKAIPAKDADKIGATDIKLLAETFGPSIIFYGNLVFSYIQALPSTVMIGGQPYKNPLTIDRIMDQVDADMRAGANPAAVAVWGSMNAPIPVTGTALNPALGQEAVRRGRMFIGKQLFRNLGGPSAANNERATRIEAATGRNYDKLRGILGEDPWGAVSDPLGYEYNVLKKYQEVKGLTGQKSATYDTYVYLKENLKEALPWEVLIEGMRRNGGVVPDELERFPVLPLGAPGRKWWEPRFENKKDFPDEWEFSIYNAIKWGQRSNKVVTAVQAVMEGGDKLIDVLGALIGRYREIGGTRVDEAADLMKLSLNMLRNRKQPPPFKARQFWNLHDETLKGYGINFTGRNRYNVGVALDDAIRVAGYERDFKGDMAVAVINAAGVIPTEKPIIQIK